MVNMSNVVQKCPGLIRKMLVSMSDVVKNFVSTALLAAIMAAEGVMLPTK